MELGILHREALLPEPDLAAADAVAPLPLGAEALLGPHPQVPLRGAAEDRVRPDLPLDPLDPDPRGDELLHPGYQVRCRLGRERAVPPEGPHRMEPGPFHDERRVDLEHVRTVVGVLEDRAERVEIAVGIRPGQAGHHVVTDLEPRVLRVPGRGPGVGVRVPAVREAEHVVVRRLHAELDPGDAEAQALLDLGSDEAVRLRLDREADAPRWRGLVPGLGFIKGPRLRAVEAVEAFLDEGFPERGIQRAERSS